MDVSVKMERCGLTTQSQTNVPLDLTFHDICYTVGNGNAAFSNSLATF